MPRWLTIVDTAPDLAGIVEQRFAAHRHHTMATLRGDGSPRISGTEVMFEGGDVLIGSIPGSVKVRDLQRDPRIALHSHSEDPDDADPSAWAGDAKLSGRAMRVERSDDGAGGSDDASWFRIDVEEIATVAVGPSGDHLVITHWRPDGIRVHRR